MGPLASTQADYDRIDEVWKLLAFGELSPDVFPEASALLRLSAEDIQVREYLSCTAREYARRNGAPADYVERLSSFLRVAPTHAQFVRWRSEELPSIWKDSAFALQPKWQSSLFDYDPVATRQTLIDAQTIIVNSLPVVTARSAGHVGGELAALALRTAERDPVISNEATALIASSGEVLLAAASAEVSPYYATHELEMLVRSMDAAARKEGSGGTQPAGYTRGPWEYTLWYGTNRIAVNAGAGRTFFNESRPAGGIELGTCTVYIPKSHEFGSTGSNRLGRLLKWSDDRLKVLDARTIPADDWMDRAADALADSEVDEHDVVVYIHGYNNDFEEAAIRAAQIGFDLRVGGLMAFFSWPSMGDTSKYLADVEAAQASEVALESFLRAVSAIRGVERVHIIAHSMGNLALARTVARLSNGSPLRFGQIILAAPDVDAELFRELAKAYPSICDRATMYISPRDKAVGLAQWLRDGRPRAGYSPPRVCVPGVDTIEFAEIDLFELGHAYFAEAEPVLHDMWTVLHDTRLPGERLRLHEMEGDAGAKYWSIR
jgi:esterase/lipase superfamily enzyme